MWTHEPERVVYELWTHGPERVVYSQRIVDAVHWFASNCGRSTSSLMDPRMCAHTIIAQLGTLRHGKSGDVELDAHDVHAIDFEI